MSDALVDALQQLIESTRSDINTSVPGTIVSYDPATNRAIVRPSLPRKLANGVELDAPNIVEVPMVFPTSGVSGKQAAITLPVAPGDGVLLSFQQRSIEGWLGGKNTAPDDPRQFDLSDCVATLGLNSSGVIGNATDLVIRMDKAIITIKPDNSITLSNEGCGITLGSDGTITLRGESIIVDTPARTFPVEVHTHKDTQPRAGSNSGEPNP
jgi:hypothetical protein